MSVTPSQPRGPRRLALALTLAVTATLAVVAVPATAAATVPSCSTVYWGSLAKVATGSTTQPIVGVRTGQHPCFDRLVLDLAGTGTGKLGFDVRYVDTVRREGSGSVVALRGAADIRIVVHAPAYDVRTGTPTLRMVNRNELADVTGYSALRQVAFAGSFEGQTTIGLGVRARLPMRAFVLPGPGAGHRLVIDIYHHW